MFTEQRVRFFLFYLSVSVFLIGLPFILSFALGYKFDQRTFKFTKTGLIVLKTQPQGASIYLNGKLLDKKTPANLDELLPGLYNLKLELENYYPWFSEVKIEANKVTHLDKVILFTLRPNIKQLNKEKISSFWLDEGKDTVYYINHKENNIYKSNLEGEHYEKMADFLPILPTSMKYRFSPDRLKVLYFNPHQIGIAYLLQNKEGDFLEEPFILNYSKGNLIDVFWHSDSYHIILVSDKLIEALEARPNAGLVELVILNKKNTSAFYNIRSDTLYFLDTQKAADGNFYDNLYKLELGAGNSFLPELMKLKSDE